jgi:hypothetical protein
VFFVYASSGRVIVQQQSGRQEFLRERAGNFNGVARGNPETPNMCSGQLRRAKCGSIIRRPG